LRGNFTLSESFGCYYAYTPDYYDCSDYINCGYTCVGYNCAYQSDGTCPCSCDICATFYYGYCIDESTGTCTLCGSTTYNATYAPFYSSSVEGGGSALSAGIIAVITICLVCCVIAILGVVAAANSNNITVWVPETVTKIQL
jgi:hypothetical protein